jgi:hypothetical protein
VTDAVLLEAEALTTDDPVEAALDEAAAEAAVIAAAEVAATIEHPDVAGSDNPTYRRIDSPEPEPVDLFEAAGSPLVKRALPLLGIVAAVVVLLAFRRRRRSR